MSIRINLVGKRFGTLVVTRFSHVGSGNRSLWECECNCGSVKAFRSNNLPRMKSCGCLTAKINGESHSTHGMRKSREYGSWRAMKKRCLEPHFHAFKNYGGRGIKICDRWINSFENFFADMGIRPQNGTLERKDNEGDYTPENCIWIPLGWQAKNRRSSHRITFSGKTLIISEWAKLLGVSSATLYSRARRGLSPELILKEVA